MNRAHPELAERNRSLWVLAASPLVWAGHLLIAYAVAAVWCAKFAAGRETTLAPVRLAIALLTAVSLAAIAIIGWRGWRRHRLQETPPPHDADTPESRHCFLGFATFLLSALSAVAVLYQALAALFIRSCR
jgi:hypothetical protein